MAKKYSVEDVLNMINDGNSSEIEQFGEEDDDGSDEEWTPKGMAATEGSHSDSDEEDEPVDETDIPVTSKQSKTKQSAKDKVKKKAYRWRKVPFESPNVDFDRHIDNVCIERSEWTPYIYFKQFVTDEMNQEIAQQTNLYSVRKLGTSVNTTPKEIEQVLGMYMHMGLVQMPNVRAYWEMETKYPTVCNVMSRE